MPKSSRSAPVAKGDEVCIEFLDHSEDGNEALPFKVYGEVEKVTRTAITVVSWAYMNELDKLLNDNPSNEKRFCIVKKAITRVRKLK